MPVVENSDVVEDLERLVSQLRRGVVAPSRYDADFVLMPAVEEIRRMRQEVERLKEARGGGKHQD